VSFFQALKSLIPKEKSNGTSVSCNNVETNFDSGSTTFVWEHIEGFNLESRFVQNFNKKKIDFPCKKPILSLLSLKESIRKLKKNF
jgi:hypothetical protein